MAFQTPAHNLNALLIGTGEFSFSLGAQTAAQALAQGYRDIGNIMVWDVMPEGEMKEHYGAYRGVQRRDDLRKRKIKLSYKLTCDEWDVYKLGFVLFGTGAGDNARAAIAGVDGTPIAFSVANPSSPSTWYDVLDAAGNPVGTLTSVSFGTPPAAGALVQDTDFEVDALLGRVRFITTQTTAQTPHITAPAIVAGSTDPNYRKLLTPLQRGLFSGFGRLACYDENQRSNLVWQHRDFQCQVTVDGNPTVKGDDYSDFVLMVSIGNPVGTVSVREQ